MNIVLPPVTANNPHGIPHHQKVEAIYAALSKWSALEVTAEVEHWMVPALYGKQGKAIRKLSQSMGGVVLKVHDGICRGRATSSEAAREASKKLQERVREESRQGGVHGGFAHCLVFCIAVCEIDVFGTTSWSEGLNPVGAEPSRR